MEQMASNLQKRLTGAQRTLFVEKILPGCPSSAHDRRQAPNESSSVRQRDFEARSLDIGTSQVNSAVEDIPVSLLRIRLVTLCSRDQFRKEPPAAALEIRRNLWCVRVAVLV